MNKNTIQQIFIISITGLTFITTAQAGIPLWTLTPITGYPPSITINTTDTATVKYSVTNNSPKPHTIQMKPIHALSASGCSSPLKAHQSCTLTLSINGALLKGDITGGPVLCDQNSPLQCYQPNAANSLAIRLTHTTPIQQYSITPLSAANGSISPNTTQNVDAGTTLTFSATPDTGYGVQQWLVDNILVQNGGSTYQLANINANHTVHVTFGMATLTPSVTTLALSVNSSSNAQLTGNARTITINNTGSVNATNVVVTPTGLPSDTILESSTCSTIPAGGSCTIEVTPGSTVSSGSNNQLCTTGVQPSGSVSVSADGGLSTNINTYILGYGCIYQGGFIYSVDDTTNTAGSIGGKIAAITDTVPGQTSPSQATPDWGGYGTDIDSSLYENNTIGANDGAANSAAIINALTTMNVPLSDYAAGLCSNLSVNGAGASCTVSNTCYSNWYLPAICELGNPPISSGIPCTSGSTNIQLQLFANGNISPTTLGLVNNGLYWSSTESINQPANNSVYELFSSTSSQGLSNKQMLFGVRCSRNLD